MTSTSGYAVISLNDDADLDFESAAHADTFELTLTATGDNDGLTAETVITVEVLEVNEPPIFTDPDRMAVTEGNTLSIGREIVESFDNPEDTELVYAVTAGILDGSIITDNGSEVIGYEDIFGTVDFTASNNDVGFLYYSINGTQKPSSCG